MKDVPLTLRVVKRPESKFSILKLEHGKALKCYERALLYSLEDPSDDKHLYCFPESKGAFLKAVNKLYLISATTLRERHLSACKDFESLHDKLEDIAENIGPEPDRDVEAMRATVRHLNEKFAYLMQRALEMESASASLEELQWLWLGLNNICHLIMEEISHLSGRMDQIQNRLATEASSFNANKSLKYAVWGIVIGAALSLMSLVTTLVGKKAVIGSDFFMQAGEMKAELATLKQDDALSNKLRSESNDDSTKEGKRGK